MKEMYVYFDHQSENVLIIDSREEKGLIDVLVSSYEGEVIQEVVLNPENTKMLKFKPEVGVGAFIVSVNSERGLETKKLFIK